MSRTASRPTLTLELESKLPDGEEILDLAEEATDYTGVLAWYRDEKTGKESKVTVGDQSRPKWLTALYMSKTAAERVVSRMITGLRFSEKVFFKPFLARQQKGTIRMPFFHLPRAPSCRFLS